MAPACHLGPRPARLGVLLAVLISACGDDDGAPRPTTPDAGRDSAAPTPTVTTPTATTTATSSNGPPPVPVDCPPGSTIELEPNDSPVKANKVRDQSFCGSLTPAGDEDFSTFDTPPGKKLALFQAIIEGPVDFELTVNGNLYKPTDVKSFEAGTYTVRAFTKDNTAGKYRYRVQFQP
ncbi:MAG: hypothetical protein U0270_32625 [Labilithrix sp.]